MLTGQSWTATTDTTGAGKFSAVKTGSTYATGWGYNANSLNTSIVERTDGVETQRWTLAYNALGDVTRVTDVTAGNLIGRASTYDSHGRLLGGSTMLGLPVSYMYAPRGYVRERRINGQSSTYSQNALGLTTEVWLPDGQFVVFEYDATHRLTGVRLNGALVTGKAIRRGISESTRRAILLERMQRTIEALIRPAYAQVIGLPAGPMGVTAGMPLPGQPSTNSVGILMGDDRPGTGAASFPPFDSRAAHIRWLAEKLADFCRCDPSGGFDKPTLTGSSYVHVVMGGHTSPAFGNKSYFTEPVNQSLVDEIVAKSGAYLVQGKERVYYASDMGRNVGYKRDKSGLFQPTREATLRVQDDNCDRLFRVRGEVVTTFPGPDK